LQFRGEKNILIFDLGGATFDVSIITIEDGKYEVKATAGNTHLGGEDFDNRMVKHFVQEFKHKYQKDLTTNKRAVSKLRAACERAKCILSVSPQASIEVDSLFEGIDFYTSISRDTFEELNRDLFRSIMVAVEDSLRDAKMENKQIHDIVLVGGSTRIPKVQELLQDFFNVSDLNKSINSDEAVAYGAAVQAAILAGEKSEKLPDLVLLDVTPLPLGIGEIENGFSAIIKRNTTIPKTMTETYIMEIDNQENMQFEVLELAKATITSLGRIEGKGIPPESNGFLQIEVTFNIDANGILYVSTVENSPREENKITFTNGNGRLSSEEIERMVKDAQKYRAEDEMQKQTNCAQHALESYCFNMRSLVDGKLKDKISKPDKNTILVKCNEVILWLNANQLAKKEDFETQQKELESVCNPIIKIHTMVQDFQVHGARSWGSFLPWKWLNRSRTNN
jgi:L1 cell adhesion molecule like protein